MKTKKVLSVILAAGLSVGALSMEASAALYQRHQSNDATFETLKEAHENAPGFIMSEYPARTYSVIRLLMRIRRIQHMCIVPPVC